MFKNNRKDFNLISTATKRHRYITPLPQALLHMILDLCYKKAHLNSQLLNDLLHVSTLLGQYTNVTRLSLLPRLPPS